MYVCMYMCVCVCVCMYVCMGVWVYGCMGVWVCVCPDGVGYLTTRPHPGDKDRCWRTPDTVRGYYTPVTALIWCWCWCWCWCWWCCVLPAPTLSLKLTNCLGPVVARALQAISTTQGASVCVSRPFINRPFRRRADRACPVGAEWRLVAVVCVTCWVVCKLTERLH